MYDNNTSTGSGNDFIIDDILVSRCLIKVNLVDDENELESDACSKDDKTLTIDKAQLTKYFAEAWFQWQKSNTGTGGWTNIGTPTQNNTLTVTPTASNVWYRAKIGGSAQDVASDNISPTSCTNDTYSSAFRLKLADEIEINLTADNTSVCPGDALKLTGSTTAANPTYAWAFSENGDFALDGLAASKTYFAAIAVNGLVVSYFVPKDLSSPALVIPKPTEVPLRSVLSTSSAVMASEGGMIRDGDAISRGTLSLSLTSAISFLMVSVVQTKSGCGIYSSGI